MISRYILPFKCLCFRLFLFRYFFFLIWIEKRAMFLMLLISLDPFMWSMKTQFDWVNLNQPLHIFWNLGLLLLLVHLPADLPCIKALLQNKHGDLDPSLEYSKWCLNNLGYQKQSIAATSFAPCHFANCSGALLEFWEGGKFPRVFPNVLWLHVNFFPQIFF